MAKVGAVPPRWSLAAGEEHLACLGSAVSFLGSLGFDFRKAAIQVKNPGRRIRTKAGLLVTSIATGLGRIFCANYLCGEQGHLSNFSAQSAGRP